MHNEGRQEKYNMTQIEFLEMKNTRSELKNTLEGINILDTANENISKLKVLAVETIKTEKQRGKMTARKMHRPSESYGTTISMTKARSSTLTTSIYDFTGVPYKHNNERKINERHPGGGR